MQRIRRRLTLGHSPDPDDAFMFYALAEGKIDSRGWEFEHILADIQTLNDRALRGELDITAISIHAYPFVAHHYALTHCGASMGDGYGPIVVSRDRFSIADLSGRQIAIPGERTTANLALNLLIGPQSFEPVVVRFDQIPDFVRSGRADAGLLIHEGQLTYSDMGLQKVVDLGAWWKETTGLPLPLGGNCIRRAMGQEAMTEVTAILKQSIEFGLSQRKAALAHAGRFARDLPPHLTDQFVGMYVNRWTLDYGDTGRQAIVELLRRGHQVGMVPDLEQIDFVG